MSILDTLITDRTQADVERVVYLNSLFGYDPKTATLVWIGTTDELAEWMAGMKGSYNATDLNRVTGAMEYIAEHLRGYGYAVELAYAKTWAASDIPNPEQMNGYLADLSTLRSALSVRPTTPSVPATMDKLTHEEANDIEKILLDVDALLTLMTGSFLRCGAVGVVCGARGLPTEGGYVARTWEELDDTGWGWPEWDEKTWTEIAYRRI